MPNDRVRPICKLYGQAAKRNLYGKNYAERCKDGPNACDEKLRSPSGDERAEQYNTLKRRHEPMRPFQNDAAFEQRHERPLTERPVRACHTGPINTNPAA
jgi:hypothetical protein